MALLANGGMTMIKRLEVCAAAFVQESALNHVTIETTGREIRLFDEPLMGFASARDALFDEYLRPGVIGPHYRKPEEWLTGAKTVFSFFLPFTEEVRAANRAQQAEPGQEWLYGRIEGQRFVFALCEALRQELEHMGFAAVTPSASEAFWTVSEPDENGLSYTSNWSERHAAYACGLGTFGLSKGLITEKGMAGRFGSLVTAAEIAPTPRAYTQVYEYCIRCGKCIRRCPGHAITLENGKDHHQCLQFQRTIMPRLLPRFGCGLCQTDVPCEHTKPLG